MMACWCDSTLICHPDSWLLFDGTHTTRHPLSSTSAVSFDQEKVVREFATSRDGTRVPVNIIMGKDTRLDGNHPMLLTGYGGYGVSLSPGFNPA